MLIALLSSTLLGGALGLPGTAAAANVSGIRSASQTCPSKISTYNIIASGALNSRETITRFVDWNPAGSSTLVNAGVSEQVFAKRLFLGGGTRIFAINYSNDGTALLRSYQDKSESGGSLLSAEYTFADRAGQNWPAYMKIWSDSQGRVVNFDEAGNLNVYVIQLPDGTSASARMSRLAQLPANSPAATALRESTNIWSAGDKVFGLHDGTVRSWDYQATLNGITLGPADAGTVLISGLTDVVTGWSPAPNIVYTKTADGTVNKYAGTPLTLVDGDVATGVAGGMFAAAAPCLTDASDSKPYVGQVPDDSDVPPAPAVPSPDAPSSGPGVVSGKFVLGDGRPAAGMQVVVEASDLLPDDSSAVDLPDLGKVMTAADGTWSLTIPDPLPPAVEEAVSGNGGALNVTATTVGHTTSGVRLVGTDHLTAAPPAPDTGKPTPFAASVGASGAHTVQLMPLPSGAETTVPEPTAEQLKTTYANSVESQPAYDPDAPTPLWQSDRGPAPTDYNPYVVNGTNISAEPVTPYIDVCKWHSVVIARQIAYTTVGESHAYWDAAGYADYSSKLSSTFDLGYSVDGKNWKVGGSVSLGSSIAATVGFTWRGPYFAKQLRVPIEYSKVKVVNDCYGDLQAHYEIRAGRYKIPAGGAVATYGKDARHLDGPTRFSQSNPRYRAQLPPGFTFALKKGKSVKWAGAATAFGYSVGGSSSYDSEHGQYIRAGGKTTNKHDVWGLYAQIDANAGVIYSW